MSEASGTILLAEDHAVNQRIVAAMLQHLGYHVEVVADGQQAADAALAAAYGAVLMDCQLPVIDGYEATMRIRVAEGTARHTPIIAVTASGTPADQQRCVAAGMDDHLMKPLTLEELDRVLRRWTQFTPRGAMIVDPVERATVTSRTERDPQQPVLDMEVIGRLRALGRSAGEDLIGQLTQIFIEDSEVAIGELNGAVVVGDADIIVRTAHALSGASANVGATELSRLFATLEVVDFASGWQGVVPTLTAVEAEFTRVRSALGSLGVETP
jgi:two-component system sensor histidine kinase/response regulator